MAKSNSTSQARSGYRYPGTVTPINTLSNDPSILKLAGKLHDQGKRMAEAHLSEVEFHYRPIKVPADLQHIFG